MAAGGVLNSLLDFEQGHGETVFLIHGFPSPFVPDDPLVTTLSTSHHVVVFRLPGFNSKPLKDGAFLTFVQTIKEGIEEFVEQNRITSYSLVGCSLGGMMSLSLARVLSPTKLVLIKTPLGERYVKVPLKKPAYSLFFLVFGSPLLRKILYKIIQSNLSGFLLFFQSRLNNQKRKKKKEILKDFLQVNPFIMSDLLASLRGLDLKSICSQITVPSLLVVGNKDPLVNYTQYTMMYEALTHSFLYVMDGIEHWNTLTLQACISIQSFLLE